MNLGHLFAGCFFANACSAFIATAHAQTTPITQPAAISAAPKKTMIEYRYALLDYYFMTARANEIATLDTTAGWARTGEKFDVFVNPVGAEQNANGIITASATLPILRFAFPQIAKNGQRYSHFYTLNRSEGDLLVMQNRLNATVARTPLFEGIDSYAFEPNVNVEGGRSCRNLTTPLYRAYRGPTNFPDDPNHRFTINLTTFNNLVGSGWTSDGIVACVPASSLSGQAGLAYPRPTSNGIVTCVYSRSGSTPLTRFPCDVPPSVRPEVLSSQNGPIFDYVSRKSSPCALDSVQASCVSASVATTRNSLPAANIIDKNASAVFVVARPNVSGGWDTFCTGTVIKNSKDSTSFGLTAAHCVFDSGVPDNLYALFFVESSSCGGTPKIQNLGADSRAIDVVARTGQVDSVSGDDLALLVIRGSLPVGISPAKVLFSDGALNFSAEVGGQQEGQLTYSISHPYGLEKSGGFFILDKPPSVENSNWYHVKAQGSTVRPGSSGSGLFSLAPTIQAPVAEFSGLHGVLSQGPIKDVRNPTFSQCTVAGELISKYQYTRLDRFQDFLEAHIGK